MKNISKKQLRRYGLAGVSLVLSLALAGCETYGESAALGGLIGAASGAIIGNQSGSQGEGAVIGAVVGSAIGAIAKDQQVRREAGREHPEPVTSEDEVRPRPRPDERDYANETLVLEDVTVLPSIVRRGNLIEVSIQYAVLGAADGVRLKESRALLKDGEEVELFSSQLIYRANGSWVSPQQFRISERLAPGSYEIVQTVESRNARISGRSTVYIE